MVCKTFFLFQYRNYIHRKIGEMGIPRLFTLLFESIIERTRLIFMYNYFFKFICPQKSFHCIYNHIVFEFSFFLISYQFNQVPLSLYTSVVWRECIIAFHDLFDLLLQVLLNWVLFCLIIMLHILLMVCSVAVKLSISQIGRRLYSNSLWKIGPSDKSSRLV